MTRQIARILTLHSPRCQERFGAVNCTAGRVESGNAQAGSANTLTLRAGASAVDDAFNGMTARLTDGTGRERRISDYVGATKVATVESRWQANFFQYADDFGNAYWTKTVNIAADGDWWTLEDDNAAGWESLHRTLSGGAQAGTDHVLSIKVEKTGPLAYYPLLRMTFSGGTNVLYGVGLNTNTGEVVKKDSSASVVGVRDEGDAWRIWVTGNSNDNTTVRGEFFPAVGPTPIASGYSSAQTGALNARAMQVEEGTEPTDFLDTTSTAALYPTASTPYDIIDRPNACYNTRRTCRDAANFSQGLHPYKFTLRDDPIPAGELVRPYLTKIEHSPTQLDFEEGLGRRSDTRATATDEIAADVDQDLYALDRATPAGGTWWRRYRARNLHYEGRPAELATYTVEDGIWGTPIVENFLIGAIDGPDKQGQIEILLKDPTSALDTIQTPPPTTGKLALPLGLNDLTATLETGDGAQYGASGWFRHNKEVIRFTSRTGDVLSWPDGTYRGQFGTPAEAGKVGDALQICHVGIEETFHVAVKRLFNSGGMPDAQLDLAGLQAEQTAWLPGYDKLTYCVADPTVTSTLVKELMVQAGMASCWNSELQKQVFRCYAPRSPAEIVPKVLTKEGHLLLDSVEIETLSDKRLTRVTVRFGLASATANLREKNNYLTAEGVVMADAEAPEQHGDVREREVFSRWFDLTSRSAMRTLARRMGARYTEAPEQIHFYVDPKDQDINEGDVVDLTTARYVDIHGQVKQARVIITKKHRGRRHGIYAGRITAFGDRRYGFIAPNGTPDYPNNAGYACVANAAGLMSDGTDGYRIW